LPFKKEDFEEKSYGKDMPTAYFEWSVFVDEWKGFVADIDESHRYTPDK
jgi:hypothetical protein